MSWSAGSPMQQELAGKIGFRACRRSADGTALEKLVGGRILDVQPRGPVHPRPDHARAAIDVAGLDAGGEERAAGGAAGIVGHREPCRRKPAAPAPRAERKRRRVVSVNFLPRRIRLAESGSRSPAASLWRPSCHRLEAGMTVFQELQRQFCYASPRRNLRRRCRRAPRKSQVPS